MILQRSVGPVLILALVSACGETPAEPQPLDADLLVAAADRDDDDDDEGVEIEVEGENIRRFLFGNPFTSLDYSFDVESEDGETEGWVRGTADNAQGDFLRFEADITCVSVVDESPYGRVARMGAVITAAESNLDLGDAIGAEAVWTVAPGEDGSAQSTFIFTAAAGQFPGIRDFHCGLGIPVDQFVPPGSGAQGFASVSAEIEIEVD